MASAYYRLHELNISHDIRMGLVITIRVDGKTTKRKVENVVFAF